MSEGETKKSVDVVAKEIGLGLVKSPRRRRMDVACE